MNIFIRRGAVLLITLHLFAIYILIVNGLIANSPNKVSVSLAAIAISPKNTLNKGKENCQG